MSASPSARSSPLSAGILASGRDRGWPSIEPLVNALRPQADELLVTDHNDGQHYAEHGLRVVRDAGNGGPLAGLCRLMIVARHPWLLCVPGGSPQLPSDFAARFVAAATERDVDVVVLHDGQRAQPDYCLLKVGLAGDVARYLASGGSSLQRWQERQNMSWLRAAAPALGTH